MINLIEKEKLIVVIRGVTIEQAVKISESLYNAGARFVEYAFDAKKSDKENAAILAELCYRFEDKLYIGAGTITDLEKFNLAYKSGAKYILAPDTNIEVISATKEKGLISIPGALTPTEICTAIRAGADIVKVFPVCDMQQGYIKNVLAPISNARLLAMGGVTIDNLEHYLNQGAVAVGVGSPIVKKEWVSSESYSEIEALAEKYVTLIKNRG